MTFELTVEPRNNFLLCRVSGKNTPETILAYLKAIQKECEEHGCFSVLIEEKLEGPRLDEMEIFSLISKGSPDALGFFQAVAYVDEQQEYDIIKFAETLAVNRGIPMAVFGSIPDAENWLRHRSEDDTGEDIFAGDPD